VYTVIGVHIHRHTHTVHALTCMYAVYTLREVHALCSHTHSLHVCARLCDPHAYSHRTAHSHTTHHHPLHVLTPRPTWPSHPPALLSLPDKCALSLSVGATRRPVRPRSHSSSDHTHTLSLSPPSHHHPVPHQERAFGELSDHPPHEKMHTQP